MLDFVFESMGTQLQIKVWDKIPPFLQEKIKLEILDFTYYFDETFSRFKESSLISKISKSSGIYSVPKELVEILKIYQDFAEITDGAMNPLIGHTISDLGYDANYTLQKKSQIRSTPNLNQTLKIFENTNSKDYKIELTEKVLIDIGAIGKGFWVDKVAEILERNKMTHYMANGSGDIFYKSPGNAGGLKVGLESTLALFDDKTEMLGTTEIENEAICGSGTNKRNWSVKKGENLHHVVNAKTGIPTENILSVWIKVKNKNLPTTFCDGIATAIFFVEPKILQAKVLEKFGFQFEYLIVYEKPVNNKKILISQNFNCENLISN